MEDQSKINTEMPAETPKVKQLFDIRERVKNGLTDSNSAVKEAIIQGFVDEEVSRRTKATSKVIEQIEALETEARKIKPTYSGYTLEGKPVGEAMYTQEQAKSMKENGEKQQKLHNALERALVDKDFSKVLEIGGGK